MLTVALSALASSGVNARSACCTRLPSWPSTSSGTSLGVWVTKKTPTPLERISRTVCAIESRKSLLASLNSRCASSKKNTSFGLSESPTSGRSCEQVGEQPHQERGEQRRPVEDLRQLHQRDDAPTVRRRPASRSAVSNSGSPKKLSAPVSVKAMSSRSSTPAVEEASPPRSFEVALALVGGQVLDDGLQVLEVQQRQALLVRPVEDQVQRGRLGVVEAEHLRQQHRAERGHRGPHRGADALLAGLGPQAQELAPGTRSAPSRRRPRWSAW